MSGDESQFNGVQLVGQAMAVAPADMLLFANVLIGALSHGGDACMRLRRILAEFSQGELILIEAEWLIKAGYEPKEEER